MRHLAAVVVAAAALIGGLGGAALALALGGSNDSTQSTSAAGVEAVSSRSADGPLTPEAVYVRAAPSVVVISATEKVSVPATFFTPRSSEKVEIGGSGFVVDQKGDIVTNDHVVQGVENLRVGFSGGASYAAEVVGTDPSTDLAVIHVHAPASAIPSPSPTPD